tara:strand:+ start:1328 stop:1585 length:258 start_codon:yes stop_codon:yes gene_type:complete
MNPTWIELLIIGAVLFGIFRLLSRRVDRKDRQYNHEDTETIQHLHRGMEKMAARIESLETILLDQGEHYRRTPPPIPNYQHTSRY